jgi:hypothetical protein
MSNNNVKERESAVYLKIHGNTAGKLNNNPLKALKVNCK